MIYISVFRTKNGFDITLNVSLDDWNDFSWKGKFILILSVTLSNQEKIKCPSNIKVFSAYDPIYTGSWNKPQHELMHDIGKFIIIFH